MAPCEYISFGMAVNGNCAKYEGLLLNVIFAIDEGNKVHSSKCLNYHEKIETPTFFGKKF